MSKPDLDGEGCAWMFMKLLIWIALGMFVLGAGVAFLAKAMM